MKRLADEVVRFLHNENYAIISTIDRNGHIHNSCKGIVEIDKNGRLYLLDLYKQRTFQNILHNHHIAVTVVNEHRFKGYSLKGRAKIVNIGKLHDNLVRAWEKKITSRITHRVLKNIKGEKGHKSHPEALLPTAEYLIEMKVDSIVDLTPHALK
jgi:general stress protein 26